MTEASAPGAARYNERSQSQTSVVARWMLLVLGCATSLVVAAWDTLS